VWGQKKTTAKASKAKKSSKRSAPLCLPNALSGELSEYEKAREDNIKVSIQASILTCQRHSLGLKNKKTAIFYSKSLNFIQLNFLNSWLLIILFFRLLKPEIPKSSDPYPDPSRHSVMKDRDKLGH
jgi:hypothetical protein